MRKSFLRKASIVLLSATMLMACNKEIEVKYDYNVNDYVQLGKYEDIAVTVDKTSIENQLVDDKIAEDIENNTTYSEVSRGAVDGDQILVTYVATSSGSQSTGLSNTDGVTMILGKDKLGLDIEELDEALYGMKAGETKVMVIDLPETYSNTVYAGTKVVFELTVQTVSQPNVPMLTNAYVKETFGYDTIEEYRASVKDSLASTIDSKVDDEIDIPAYLNNTVSLNTIRIRYSTVNCENKVRKWNQLLEEILKKWWAEDGLDLPSADDPVVECYIDENKHKVNTFKELITELNILYWSNKSNCNQKDIDSDFDVQVKRKLSLKEYLMMQFNYCNAIAIDILEHNKSKKIQEYVKQFAQIESPVADGTDVDWIRINWGDIYIFLYDNGSIRYQLDPHNGYGNELIDTFERGRFTAEILTLEEAPVARNGVLYYEEETGYPDDVPMYLPMR